MSDPRIGDPVYPHLPEGPKVRYFARLLDPPVTFLVQDGGRWSLDCTDLLAMRLPDEEDEKAFMAAFDLLIEPYRPQSIGYGLLGPSTEEELADGFQEA